MVAKKNKRKKIRVLQVDQFHGADMILAMKKGETFYIDNFDLDRINGGDSESAKKIFGGKFRILEIEKEDKRCDFGCARFRVKWTGRLDDKYWATNWDSSG